MQTDQITQIVPLPKLIVNNWLLTPGSTTKVLEKLNAQPGSMSPNCVYVLTAMQCSFYILHWFWNHPYLPKVVQYFINLKKCWGNQVTANCNKWIQWLWITFITTCGSSSNCFREPVKKKVWKIPHGGGRARTRAFSTFEKKCILSHSKPF